MTTSTQVSHGLNLVLKLREGVSMKDLLTEIAKAQPKIDAAFDELNFVHFARFLPTYDEKALQVITEFDGPLAPYVLDFAIEIGDVFDMLLLHTEGADHIVPIADHPAEFLAFVQDNNKVTVPGLPPSEEWSLYSAYPDKTILDIVGPRSRLPMPKGDRQATNIEFADVQGNILRGYRADRVRHFLLRVKDLHAAHAARAWLAARATPGKQSTTLPTVTSAEDWDETAKPKLMLNVGLTVTGMVALGIRQQWLAAFPSAFTQGALMRAADNFDTGTNAPEHWWLGGPGQDIHAMVSLYQREMDDGAFEAVASELRNSLDNGGLMVLYSQDAARRGGKTWLGYADGIANPRVAGVPPIARNDHQPASTAGEFVLGTGHKNIYGGTSLSPLLSPLAGNGSFCAVRVLAQDPALFQTKLQSEAKRLNVEADWLAAKLMGRWYEGAPVSLHSDAAPTQPAECSRNDFDYAPSHEYPCTPMDHEGLLCPVGAHIRRGNPRTARVAGARYTRRLMRRGMQYTRKVKDRPDEVGLFGLFICGDLERQFEFIQRQWMNGDRFASGLLGTRDPFGGTPLDRDYDFTIPMQTGLALNVHLPQFVFTRGSLYLFMPGLSALRRLDYFASNDPAVTPPTALSAVGGA